MNPQPTEHSHAWLDELETELRTQPLHVFTPMEWNILSRLPASRHWQLGAETPVQDVIEETYEVIYLEGLLEDDIDDPQERAWYVEMFASSPVLCSPLQLRNEIGALLMKLIEMPRKQEHDLARLLLLSFRCFLTWVEKDEDSPAFSRALARLQASPIWTAYVSVQHISSDAVRGRRVADNLTLQMGQLH
ncbi:MAG: hypothetical protein CVU22_02555 [Betaproteobacteria bacterium HGW-Betaproteobacteria-16]|nr:MAG: hypothetical protein CVU22_02555 [Betaproteobacteria bacterium HGW-Betaproteobacteria-16]